VKALRAKLDRLEKDITAGEESGGSLRAVK